MRSVIPYGQYQLLDRLAVGGMAELFLAKRVGEAGFQKTCVVKRVLPYLGENPEFVQMFLDEARIAARLDHPGVVQVFELGRHETSYFIAMEYLAGSDLVGVARKAIAENRPIPVDVAVRIAAQAAEPLHYAHEFKDERGRPLGIVHRDISPSNLFVTCQGTVKILDFGVAFAHEREQQTETGQVKGKAGYMSPEQCLGYPVDRRTDVWALGVVLYELLSGHRLFEGKTTAQAALQVCQKAIPHVREVRPDVPEAVDAAVMRALHRDVEQRWPTAQAFQTALEGSLSASPHSNPLAHYLRSLFGEAWVAEQMARTEAPGAAVRSGGTEPLMTAEPATEAATMVPPFAPSGVEAPARTVPPSPAATPKAPRRAGLGAALGVSAVAVAIAAALAIARWRPPQPQPPRPATPPPSAPAAAAPPPVAAPSPSVTPVTVEQPRTEPAKPAPAPSRASRPAVKARPAAAKVTRTGKVSLVTQPFARVFFNGKELGPTPLFDYELPAGNQTLTLIGEDGVARALQVSVQEAAVTQLRLRLDKLPAEGKRR